MGTSRTNIALANTQGAESYQQDAIQGSNISGIGNSNIVFTGAKTSNIAQGLLGVGAGGGGGGGTGSVVSISNNPYTTYMPITVQSGTFGDKAVQESERTKREAMQTGMAQPGTVQSIFTNPFVIIGIIILLFLFKK